MRLVLAEKPSVAQGIAKVLGVTGRKDGYLEGCGSPVATSKCGQHLEAPTEPTGETGYIVTWCVGHLVELAAADVYDPRYSKWVREDLPIVPEPWQFAISTGTKKQFDILAALMKRPDVDSLYDAALCRAKADWLVGINGTRLFTTLYRGKTLNVGRVMTPTLTLLVEREAAISGFRKEKFYMVELNCNTFAASERITGKETADKLARPL